MIWACVISVTLAASKSASGLDISGGSSKTTLAFGPHASRDEAEKAVQEWCDGSGAVPDLASLVETNE